MICRNTWSRLTDAQGRLIDFKNTLIILTSNIGSKVIEKGAQGGLGFDTVDDQGEADYSRMSAAVQEELKQYFRPEFLNRLDEIIVFNQLTKKDVRKIADIMIKQLCKRVSEQGYNLEVTDSVKERLTDDGFNPIYGARPLRRLVTKYVEDLISENILKNPLTSKTRTIKIQLNEDDEIIVKN